MDGLLKSLMLWVMTPECFDIFFEDRNFLHVLCLKATSCKCLGLVIITGSMMVKLPQVLKILNNNSAQGVSIASVLLDLLAISSNMAYSYVKEFPFSAWGEGLFLALQTAAMAALVFYYNHSKEKSSAFIVGYLTFMYILMDGITPVNVLWAMQALNLPIIITGKCIQAWTNYQNGGTGQLSAVTSFALLFGSTARIFTSIEETGDLLVILTYLAATSLNAVIVAQFFYYWRIAKDKKE